MTRTDALTYAKVAGYHGDSKAFTRLIIEARVGRAHMNRAWHTGERAKAAGVPCSCPDCKTTRGGTQA